MENILDRLGQLLFVRRKLIGLLLQACCHLLKLAVQDGQLTLCGVFDQHPVLPVQNPVESLGQRLHLAVALNREGDVRTAQQQSYSQRQNSVDRADYKTDQRRSNRDCKVDQQFPLQFRVSYDFHISPPDSPTHARF